MTALSALSGYRIVRAPGSCGFDLSRRGDRADNSCTRSIALEIDKAPVNVRVDQLHPGPIADV